MKRAKAFAIVIAFGLGGLAGAFASFELIQPDYNNRTNTTSGLDWIEVPWPFSMDEWGQGRAFRCPAGHCGSEINLYVRAKIGFCSCTEGVSDDNEVDRLSDFSFMGEKPFALAAGYPIIIGWMKGRSRPYGIEDSPWARKLALSIALNNHCDAIVVTALFAQDRLAEIQPRVIAFLNGKPLLTWIQARGGL